MRLQTALPLTSVLLALIVSTAGTPAASAQGHLDRSFGHFGIATAAVPKSNEAITSFTVGVDGRVYVLDRSLVLAFQSDGTIAGHFGQNGRVPTSPAHGEHEPAGLGVDSQGRLLLVGSAYMRAQKRYVAHVVRLLPNGSRDASFGQGGEVNTNFDLPAARAGSERPSVGLTSILVDALDRPVVAGSFGDGEAFCGWTEPGPAPFVGRLTNSGAIDTSFAGTGHAVLDGPGIVSSFSQLPDGGTGVFTTPCSYGARVEWQPPQFTTLAGNGSANPLATERQLGFSYVAPTIDPSGRVVELESPPPIDEYGSEALARYLPNGDRDPGFGRHGRTVLRGGWEASAFAVDAEGRPIIAAAKGLRRFLLDGRIDMGFGPRGRLAAAKGLEPIAITLDALGRIYTAGLARKPSRTIVRVARFIPGN